MQGMIRRSRNFWQITLAIGAVLCLYSGYLLWQLPYPTDEQLAPAVEDRYRGEISRMQRDAGASELSVSPEWRDKFHAAIRAELLAPYEERRRPAYGYLALGLMALVIGAGSFISGRFEKSPGR
jgi:hypothetical protein